MKYPWLSETQIDAAASNLLRRAFGKAFTPVALVDLDAIVFDCLAENEGLIFDDTATLGGEGDSLILGKTLPIAGKILVSRQLGIPAERGRRRFTIAHELGHWVLHRPVVLAAREHLDLFASDEFDTAAFSDRHDDIFANSPRQLRPEEWQANRFASFLLIDEKVLRTAFVERFGEPPAARHSPKWRSRTASLRDHARLLARLRSEDTEALNELFGVSVEAMAIALESGGYATEIAPAL